MTAHSAIKDFGYGCSEVFHPFSLILSSTIRLHGNKAITDASCPALADLLRRVPTLKELK